MTVEVVTPKRGTEAKQEAFDRAAEEAALKLARDVLGEDRAAKEWSQIKPKLLKNVTRYILYTRGSPPEITPEGTKISVQMRLSVDGMESLLRELKALAPGTVRLLPLIEVQDEHGDRYIWWADHDEGKDRTPARRFFKKLIENASSRFKTKNIYVLDPTSESFRMSVPSNYRTQALRREDQILLAQYLKADAVLSGRLVLSRTRSDSNEVRLNYDLQLWQAKTGRNVAEESRTEASPSDKLKVVSTVVDRSSGKIFQDLAAQLADLVASGNLNLGVVRVAVVGGLSYPQQVEFKKQLTSVREIRDLRERLFEPGKLVYEAETALNGDDLARVLQRARFSTFRVDVDSARDDGLVLSVKALSSASAQ
ncbi:MAG: hypothetical protein AB7G93_22880 [Bdellovibrionales bacterium]